MSSKPKYRYVLFDLDGTLAESGPGIQHAVVHVLETMNYAPITEELLQKFIGPPILTSFRDLCGFSEEKAAECRKQYREYYREIVLSETELYPGVKEMLQSLKEAGCTMAVATTKPQNTAEMMLQEFGISGYFDAIVGGGPWGDAKTIIVDRALTLLGCKGMPGESVMVGDRCYDILGAKDAGIDSIGAGMGYALPGELQDAGATYIASDPEEIRRIVLGEESCHG